MIILTLAEIQYIEINAISTVLLSVMYISIIKANFDLRIRERNSFMAMLAVNILLLVSDSVIILMYNNPAPVFRAVSHTVSVLYFSLHGAYGYCWLRYCIRRLYPEFKISALLSAVLALPGLVCVFLAVASPWTKWVYYLTSQNIYKRGDKIVPLVLLSLSYLLISTVLVIIDKLRSKEMRERSTYTTLILFPIPTIMGCVLQMLFPGISLVWICSAISALILFINIQNENLSKDTLTGLNNRLKTDRRISWEQRNLQSGDYYLYVIMADIDKFKRINDEYGHMIGDRAIIETADILESVCRGKAFVGRFGGDEFVIVGRNKNKNGAEVLIHEIEKSLERFNASNTGSFSLSLSMGYGIFEGGTEPSVDKIISTADKEMYKVKIARKRKDESNS